MMINESVKYFSHSHVLLGSCSKVGRSCQEVRPGPRPGSRSHTPRQEGSSWVNFFSFFFFLLLLPPSSSSFFFFFCSCVFEKPAAVRGGSHSWEPAHIKIQVQGREDERRTLWACGTTHQIVVCQWLLSQLITELGKRSIVPVRWSHFQLAAYWDSNLWQY